MRALRTQPVLASVGLVLLLLAQVLPVHALCRCDATSPGACCGADAAPPASACCGVEAEDSPDAPVIDGRCCGMGVELTALDAAAVPSSSSDVKTSASPAWIGGERALLAPVTVSVPVGLRAPPPPRSTPTFLRHRSLLI